MPAHLISSERHSDIDCQSVDATYTYLLGYLQLAVGPHLQGTNVEGGVPREGQLVVALVGSEGCGVC